MSNENDYRFSVGDIVYIDDVDNNSSNDKLNFIGNKCVVKYIMYDFYPYVYDITDCEGNEYDYYFSETELSSPEEYESKFKAHEVADDSDIDILFG